MWVVFFWGGVSNSGNIRLREHRVYVGVFACLVVGFFLQIPGTPGYGNIANDEINVPLALSAFRDKGS